MIPFILKSLRKRNPGPHSANRAPLRQISPSSLSLESLEPRLLLTSLDPNHYDQYLLELINRARANPAEEASLFGIDLNEGLTPNTISYGPKQPLAFHGALIAAAHGHSQWMLDTDTFSHYETGGVTPTQRMSAAGYPFTGSYGTGENIGWTGSTQSLTDARIFEGTAELHQSLFVDSGVSGRGHRLNILNPDFKEIGLGLLAGDFTAGGTTYHSVIVTEDFAYQTGSSFLTGVAYNDALVDNDAFYTPGEGLGNISIVATRLTDNAQFSTTTFDTGGYALQLPPGAYNVSASGSGLISPILYQNVAISSQNVKLDFLAGQGGSTDLYVTIGEGQLYKKLTYTDADGTLITVSHSVGQATLHFLGTSPYLTAGKAIVSDADGRVELSEITLANTTLKSSLAFKTKGGDGLGTVGSIGGATPVGTLSANTIDLVDSGIYMTDSGFIGSIRLHNTQNGAGIVMYGTAAPKGISITADSLGENTLILLGAGLKSLTARQCQGVSLSVPWANSIKVKGDFAEGILFFSQDADPAIRALGTFTVGGRILESDIVANGRIGTITSGTLENSRIFAGVDLELVNTLGEWPQSALDFTSYADISSLTLKGLKNYAVSFYNSDIAAWNLGKISLKTVDVLNGNPDGFGLVAHTIASLTFSDTLKTTKITKQIGPKSDIINGLYTIRLV